MGNPFHRLKTCSTRILNLLLLALIAFALFGLAPAQAQLGPHANGLFELDENAFDESGPGLPDDWTTLYDGGALTGGSSKLFIFAIDPVDSTNPVTGLPQDDDIFTGGGSKDTEDVPAWLWKFAEPNDKNDIQHLLIGVYEDPFTMNLIFYFAVDKLDNSGDAALGIWFLQGEVNMLGNGAAPGTGFGPDSHLPDDVAVQVDFTNGGDIERLDIYQWDVGPNPSGICGQAHVQVQNTPLWRVCSAQDCDTAAATDPACGQVINDGTMNRGVPWNLFFKPPGGKVLVNEFPTATFFEGGIDISRFLGRNVCFGSVLADSRNSQSETSTWEDKVLRDFALCSLEVTKAGPELSKVGDTATYTFTILNDGSVTLFLQSADDDVLGDLTATAAANGCGTLAPGAMCSFDVDYDPMVGDPDPLENVFVAVYNTASDGSGDDVDDADDHSLNLFQPAISVTKDAVQTLSKVGDTIDYDIDICNDSSADTPNLVCSATDSLLGSLTVPNPLPLGCEHYDLTYQVQAGDPDPLVNTVNVMCSVDGFGNVLMDSDGDSVDLFGVDIDVQKSASDTIGKVGDTITYTFTLSNNSDAGAPDLTCTATDDVLGVIFGPAVLPLGDTVIMQDRDIMAGDPDPLVNTVTMDCDVDGFPNMLSDSASDSVDLFSVAIDADKTADDTIGKVGDTVNYTITLSNNSSADAPALNCTATDSLLGVVFNGVLPLGDTVINTPRDIMAGDPDPLVNTVTLDCTVDGRSNVLQASDGHSIDLFSVAIDADKTADDTIGKVGDTVNYTITLSNNSSADAPALNCTATDTLLGVVFGPAVLPLGDTVINTPRDIMAGDPDPLVNTVTLDCTVDGRSNVLQASDGHSVDLFSVAIDADKTADDTIGKVGDTVNYTITLSNNSSADAPALNCTATDSLLGVVFGPGVLPLGDTVINTPRDIMAGDPDPLVNTVTLDCTVDGRSNVLQASDGHSVDLFSVAIDADKTADRTHSKVGDTITYDITLSNNSSADAPALNCTATDSILGVVFGPAVLPLGDTTVNPTYDPQAGDPNPLVNTVTLDCTVAGRSNVLQASDGHSVILVDPSLTVVKSCLEGEPVPPGASVNFAIDIVNTGDVELLVDVFDPLLGINSMDTTLGVDNGCVADNNPADGCWTIEAGVIAGEDDVFNEVDVTWTLPAIIGPDLPNTATESDDALCEVEVGGATRTRGFWQTHASDGTEFLDPVAFGYTCHVFDVHLGGTIDLGWVILDSCAEAVGAFWANNAKESDGSRRDKTCQAKVQASKQLVAAILNTGLTNGAPVPIDPETGLDIITAIQLEMAGPMDRKEILRLSGLLDEYNNSGDDVAIVDGDGAVIPHADPNGTKAIMDITAVDCP